MQVQSRPAMTHHLRNGELNKGIQLGFIEQGYKSSAAENGMIQCPTCHLSYFTPKHIALSPAKEVLQWYTNYLMATSPSDRKPLYEISRMLSRGQFDGLPAGKSIIPFTSLYSIVVLKPQEEDRYRIVTSSQPNLSILLGNEFVPAPPEASPGDPNVVRIFDVLGLPSSSTPIALGQIPLSASNPEFNHRRLWRLPMHFPVALATFLSVIQDEISDVEEIRLALGIRILLQAPSFGFTISGGGSHNTGDSVNDEDKHIDRSTKCSFDQFNDDKLALAQDANQGGGDNDDYDF